MLTAFGKEVRKIRLDRGELLKTMADSLGVKSSYLSAIEHGKKAIPKSFICSLTSLYSLSQNEIENLEKAADLSKQNVNINLIGKDADLAGLANAFARKFDSLTENQIKAIEKVLKED